MALARALAAAPDLFLFDEPFSALDAETHEQLREELKSFLRALAIPAIFVSHDRSDAMTLADKIIVLRGGAVIQSGPRQRFFASRQIHSSPAFVGVENVLSGRVVETSKDCLTVTVGDRTCARLRPRPPMPAEALCF